uniref:ARAD1C10802p n=1 Tax=Blastobotrys adeninivorans TaxID=409370 RepID=A0A060T5C0_BLAAD
MTDKSTGSHEDVSRDRSISPPSSVDRARSRHRSRHESRGSRGRHDSRGSPHRSRDSSRAIKHSSDERTVFVRQLAARVHTDDLIDFFEDHGLYVYNASIVKDRHTNRSKGLAFVEFEKVAEVPRAVALTGKKLLGIPIIVEYTEASKKHANGGGEADELPSTDHRPRSKSPRSRQECTLVVDNISFKSREGDIEQAFEDFGTIVDVEVRRDRSGRSLGYAFVEYDNSEAVDVAIDKMDRAVLGGRTIRLFREGSRRNSRSRSVSRSRSRSQPRSRSRSHRHRSRSRSPRRADRGPRRRRDMDDGDVKGISYKHTSRVDLMNKLMRRDESEKDGSTEPPESVPKPDPASRCIVLRNMFNAEEETGDNWVQELEEDVKLECEDKYGPVIHIAVDQSGEGEIYVKFAEVSMGMNAIKGLNGRFFGGRRVSASPVVELVYSLKFPKAPN